MTGGAERQGGRTKRRPAGDDEGRGAWDEGRVHGEPFVRNALLFGRILRRVGLSADLSAVLDFGRALTLVDLGHREEVKAAGAALFCRRREDLTPYGLAFERFWRRHLALQETG
ncbi:MAG: hypothetical protein KGL53_16730, partial [Elusimicrobia bacterium]|nr:hypothetical protein [Elusimicrobiota bacterium]